MTRAFARRILQPGLLEYPQYTRPAEFRDLKVPEVLLSGNHAEIARWRAEQARYARRNGAGFARAARDRALYCNLIFYEPGIT